MNRFLAYLVVALGTCITAMSTNWLVIPNQLAGGGFNGIMTVVKYLSGIEMGMPLFLLNLPFLIWLYRLSGWAGVIRTAVSVAVFSVVIDLTAGLSAMAPTHDRWLASVWAGIFSGVGNWLIFYAGGSSGGTALIAKIVRITKGWEVQTFLFASDALIMILAGVAMRDMQMTMYSVVMAFFIRYTLDSLSQMIKARKKVTIHSAKAGEIAQAIIGHVRRGVTLIQGTGAYTGKPTQVIECIVSNNELRAVVDLARMIDSRALVDVITVCEAYGPGFDLPTKNRPLPAWKRGVAP